MVVLNFTLTPEAASKVHDLLVCLGKFSETVAIEARREKVGLPLFLLFSLASYTSCISLHLPLSTLQNPPTPLLRWMVGNSSRTMSACRVMADLTAALHAACTQKRSCRSLKVACTTR
jgi:hypothetical protein